MLNTETTTRFRTGRQAEREAGRNEGRKERNVNRFIEKIYPATNHYNKVIRRLKKTGKRSTKFLIKATGRDQETVRLTYC